MSTRSLAEQYHFLSSPTIRINWLDLIETVTETAYGCCSEISGTDVDCRSYEYKGQTYDVPPKEMLAEAILTAVFSHSFLEILRAKIQIIFFSSNFLHIRRKRFPYAVHSFRR